MVKFILIIRRYRRFQKKLEISLKKESPITEGDIFFMPNFKASYWTRSVHQPDPSKLPKNLFAGHVTNDEVTEVIGVPANKSDMVMVVSLLGNTAESVENQKLLFNSVLPSLSFMNEEFVVPYPSTRIVLQDHIYMDVPTAYMDINPLGSNNKGYYNSRTLNREGKFTNDQSSLIISAYGPQKPSYKTMEISEEEKIKSEQELFYDIGTTHRDRRPHYERKLENYNWLIQDDATGYTYTTKTTDVGEKDILGCIIEEM